MQRDRHDRGLRKDATCGRATRPRSRARRTGRSNRTSRDCPAVARRRSAVHPSSGARGFAFPARASCARCGGVPNAPGSRARREAAVLRQFRHRRVHEPHRPGRNRRFRRRTKARTQGRGHAVRATSSRPARPRPDRRRQVLKRLPERRPSLEQRNKHANAGPGNATRRRRRCPRPIDARQRARARAPTTMSTGEGFAARCSVRASSSRR